ncbi:acyltransferase family protein [Acinetobacter junii]|uniref:Acyltransferase n=1 Tax=Acinetobacter junii TaxID=40215 RepID=A0AAX1MFA5_ACIJU|nr:acyltransferase family protein [Acinetobacter junii]QUY35614.1 acyltransferase [Acinetobacter junii]
MKYRTEIDGLRAIAVLLVIFNHLGLSFFSGGYVGVDVFFVISGFLITSIISKEITDKTFTFKNFYKKRILRLAPAYFLVIFSCFIFSYFLLAPMELVSFYKSVMYSLVFASNFFMWKEVGGYFSANAEYIPLLHLWSLGVEEQFYIIWPTILMIMLAWFKRWTGLLIALGVILGCVFAHILSIKAPAMSYFLLPARAFELMIGAAIVFIKPNNFKAVTANIIAAVGLIMIVFSSFYLTSESIFPGFYALLPCVGTALIIYSLKGHDGIIKKFLSMNIMSFFGKISYPLYLWHWPLIVFYKIRFGELSYLSMAGLMIAMTLLSYLTYEYVERKIQNKYKGSNPARIVLKGYLIPVLAFAAFSGFVVYEDGLKQRFSNKVPQIENSINSASYKIRGECLYTPANKLPPEDKCILGVKEGATEVLLVGDSHANHYSNMINVMLKDANTKGYEIDQNSSFFLPDVERYVLKDGTKKLAPEFKTRNDLIKKHLADHKYKYVVLAGSYADNFIVSHFKDGTEKSSSEVMESGLDRAIDLVESTGAKALIIKGMPKVQELDQNCPLRKEMFGDLDCGFDRKIHDEHFKKWNEMLSRLEAKHKDLVVIDIEPYFCDAEKCYLDRNGTPLYIDQKHINYVASGEVGKWYIKTNKNHFKD